MSEERELDWLEGEAEEQREELHTQAIERARLYEVFINTARGRELLGFWEEAILDKATPVESSLQRYVADESVRDFVRGIRRQIKIAQERI